MTRSSAKPVMEHHVVHLALELLGPAVCLSQSSLVVVGALRIPAPHRVEPSAQLPYARLDIFDIHAVSDVAQQQSASPAHSSPVSALIPASPAVEPAATAAGAFLLPRRGSATVLESIPLESFPVLRTVPLRLPSTTFGRSGDGQGHPR